MAVAFVNRTAFAMNDEKACTSTNGETTVFHRQNTDVDRTRYMIEAENLERVLMRQFIGFNALDFDVKVRLTTGVIFSDS